MTEAAAAEPVFVPLASEPVAPPRELKEIREAGVLRLLVTRTDADLLPREGSPAALDLARAWDLAEQLGAKPRFIFADDPAALLAAFERGIGDILMLPLEQGATPPWLRTTSPLAQVDEVVAMPATAAAPKRLKDLERTTVAVRRGSRGLQTLQRLDKNIPTVLVAATVDDEDLLQKVGAGEATAAVVDSAAVASYLRYQDDVKAVFTLRSRVSLCWGIRAGAPKLLEATNGAFYEEAMTEHHRAEYGGDLDEIRKRKVLRVAMLNNGASYFLYRGMEAGFQYELARLFAARLDVRLQVIVPDRPGELLTLLADKRVDLAPIPQVGSEDPAFAYTIPFITADLLLVQHASEPPIMSVQGLAGREVHVRASSAYVELLKALQPKVPGLKIVAAPEELETEELIDKVGRREIPLTVANSVLLGVELAHRDDIQGTVALAERQPLVYGLRKDAPALRTKMNQLIERELKGSAYDSIYAKYFQDPKKMRQLHTEASETSGRISPFDILVRKHSANNGLDWRLITAQMYQESRFDPNARSWVGAVGLLQIMPKTGRELGFRNLRDPETNITAATKYMGQLIAQTEPTLPMRQRVRFALAAYNAGAGHVTDARLLAKKLNLDPDRWFGNVEKAMVLLEKPQYYRRARRGFCRGSEPVGYVSRIQTKYDAYATLMPAEGEDLKGD
ncbi:MAG: transporter substrate-binding domain-containing protein [Deltaproteobacteria bacterium]|nr:transporter substrate-binding domain-containing protein [Deltaproteobacteria bacterium]